MSRFIYDPDFPDGGLPDDLTARSGAEQDAAIARAEDVAAARAMLESAGLRLPAGVEWKGDAAEARCLADAIHRYCDKPEGLCGALPLNCSVCKMLGEQIRLDYLLAVKRKFLYTLLEREWEVRDSPPSHGPLSPSWSLVDAHMFMGATRIEAEDITFHGKQI